MMMGVGLISARSNTGHVIFNGKETLMLGANDYLGLSTHPEVHRAVADALATYGTGLTIYPVFVASDLHQTMEAELADFLGVEAIMLTSSGGTANSCVLNASVGDGDLIISDSHNHASIIDAARLSKASVVTYNSRDVDHLEEVMTANVGSHNTIVVTDGVFSMDGGLAPLAEIKNLCDRHGASLMVDEAHATGVVGPQGRGSLPASGLPNGAPSVLLTGSLSKALGGAGGGFVAGPSKIIASLRERSRSYIFTQGMTTANTAASLAALRIHMRDFKQLEKLHANVAVVKASAEELGLQILPSDSAVLALLIGDENLTQKTADRLKARHIFAQGITFPIVAKGTGRLRLQPSASHNPNDLQVALATIAETILE